MTAMANKQTEFFRTNVGAICSAHGEIQRIADVAGVTRVYLSNVIHGKTSPSLELAAQIAEAIGVKLGELLEPPRDFAKKYAKAS